jgi:hypothetical protein
VVLDYYEAMQTYSRIGLLRSYGNLKWYWTTTKLWKLTVVSDYYEAMETYSRIGLLRSYGNLQSYWTTTKLWKLTVVLEYYEAMGTYGRICVRSSRFDSYIRSVASDVIIERGENYTRIGCGRWETTLESGAEDDKPQSKR